MDDVVFGHEDTDTSEAYELEDDLSLAGLDATDLEYMDADERREALEDAGLDPDIEVKFIAKRETPEYIANDGKAKRRCSKWDYLRKRKLQRHMIKRIRNR